MNKMNWNSRDRFSASIEDHNYTIATNSPQTPQIDNGDDENSAMFDPFSTIYEWTELNPLELGEHRGTESTVENVESDSEIFRNLFQAKSESSSYFDPLQTIMDDEDASENRNDDLKSSSINLTIGDAENEISSQGTIPDISENNSTCQDPPNKNQPEEFVFIEDDEIPASPPPSPSTNDVNIESYCLVPSDGDIDRSSKEGSGDQTPDDQANIFHQIDQTSDSADNDKNLPTETQETSETSETSSAGSSLIHSLSCANSSVESSASCEDLHTSNSTSLASHDDESDDQTFKNILVRNQPRMGGDDATEHSDKEWLSSSVTVQKPLKNVSIIFETKKENNSNGMKLNSKNHSISGRSTHSFLDINLEDSRRAEVNLMPGLQVCETTLIVRDINGSKKRAGLIFLKSNYTEKVYLKASNPIKNEQTCFSQNSPNSRFGTFLSSFTFGFKKLENIFPRLSLEVYNLVNYEKILEISAGDYETIKKLRRAVEDAMFLSTCDSHAKQEVSNTQTPDDKKEKSTQKNSSNEVKKSFHDSRLIRTLSQRISQHFLSRDETMDVVDDQQIFKKEEIILEFIDEYSLDISLCNLKSATNSKLNTRLYTTCILNKPFQLIVALNDRRYDIRNDDQKNIIAKQNPQTTDNDTHYVTIKYATTCGHALRDYSSSRELIIDDGVDSIIGKRFEAMRIKVFSWKDVEVDTLPLGLSAQVQINNDGQIRLDVALTCQRVCQNILLRFPLPNSWLDVFDDGSVHEAHNVNRRITTVGFSRLHSIFTGRVDRPLFEVSHGEAWFGDVTGELFWKIDQLIDQKEINRQIFLVLKFQKQPTQTDLQTTKHRIKLVPINRFVKIGFIVEDYNLSGVEPAMVRVRRSKGKSKVQISDDHKPPEVSVRHTTKFEYCVEVEVTHGDLK